MGQGNNKDTRLVALHAGAIGENGLAMLITATPPVPFKLERITGGATLWQLRVSFQGKLRLPTTLEQYLHGGTIVKPREVIGFDDLIAVQHSAQVSAPEPQREAVVSKYVCESVSASHWFLVCLGVTSVTSFPHGFPCRLWFPEVNGVTSTIGCSGFVGVTIETEHNLVVSK